MMAAAGQSSGSQMAQQKGLSKLQTYTREQILPIPSNSLQLVTPCSSQRTTAVAVTNSGNQMAQQKGLSELLTYTREQIAPIL